jgi:SAM-dependent methyltransferase
MLNEPGPRAARGYWDGVGDRWVATRPDGLWRQCSDAIHARWLDRVASGLPAGRLLKTDLFDEAFGDGLSPWFAKRGYDVVACDLALSTASGATKRQGSVAAAVADVRRLPFTTGAFDCAFSDSTLDHFEARAEIDRALRELFRVLRPGGTLLLTMDNPRNPFVWLRNMHPAFWRRVGLVPYMVGATCSARRLDAMLAAAGFAVQTTETIMHSPRVLLVPVCRRIGRRGPHRPGARWLDWLLRFEHLGRLPSWQLTGHFLAVVARKPP